MKENRVKNTWVGIHGTPGNWVATDGTLLDETGYKEWYWESDNLYHKPENNLCLLFSFDHKIRSGLVQSACKETTKFYICEKYIYFSSKL